MDYGQLAAQSMPHQHPGNHRGGFRKNTAPFRSTHQQAFGSRSPTNLASRQQFSNSSSPGSDLLRSPQDFHQRKSSYNQASTVFQPNKDPNLNFQTSSVSNTPE